MAMFRRKQEPRKPIRAETINHGVEARAILDNITVSPPLEVQSTQTGIALRLATLSGVRPAFTTTTVAGGSYTAPVSATVTLLKWGGSGLVTTGTNVTALNAFTNATAIGSGKLVWLTRFEGRWWISAADCS